MKNEKMNIVKIAKIEKLIEKSILSKGKMEFCFISIPGIGKSQLVIKTCQRLGKTLAILTPSTTTQEDITGIPIVNFGEIINAKETQTKILKTRPSWMDVDVLFIDEISNFQEKELTLLQMLISERRVGDHKFGGSIIAAGNDPDSSELAEWLPATFKSRLIPIYLEANASFYLKREIFSNPIVYEFIRNLHEGAFMEEKENPFANIGVLRPRSLDKCQTIIQEFGDDEEILLPLLVGAIGEKYGVKLHNFYKNWISALSIKELEELSLKDIESKFKKMNVEQKISTFYNVFGFLKNNKNFNGVTKFIDLVGMFEDDLDALIFKDIFEDNKEVLQDIKKVLDDKKLTKEQVLKIQTKLSKLVQFDNKVNELKKMI